MPVRDEYKNFFPGYESISDVLLMYIKIHGGHEHSMYCKNTYDALAKFFNLTDNARRISRAEYYSNDNRDNISAWNTIIQWTRQRLKNAGYLAESERGVWKLSTQGVQRADMKISVLINEAKLLTALRPN